MTTADNEVPPVASHDPARWETITEPPCPWCPHWHGPHQHQLTPAAHSTEGPVYHVSQGVYDVTDRPPRKG